jgi:F-type H+-transporting ATPase subunit delta
MAEIATIARPYAEAAFRLAEASDSGLTQWSAALGRLAQVADAAEVKHLIGNPRVTAKQLTELLVSLAGDANAQVQKFVSTLVEGNRVPALPAISAQFEELKNAKEGSVDARIDSAFDIDATQLAALVTDLEQRFKRKIRPQVQIDKELIGGIRVTVGDEVIDGSVKGKLATMSAALKS